VRYCVLIGTSHKLPPTYITQAATYIHYTSSLGTRLEYELVDAHRVCPGIHKVRVGPATRSTVATCSNENSLELHQISGYPLHHVMLNAFFKSNYDIPNEAIYGRTKGDILRQNKKKDCVGSCVN